LRQLEDVGWHLDALNKKDGLLRHSLAALPQTIWRVSGT
jgi:hypothetical protein